MTPLAETCQRCAKPLIRAQDELLCLDHGTVFTPARGWDVAGNAPADDGDVAPGKRRRAPPAVATYPLTDLDRAILAGEAEEPPGRDETPPASGHVPPAAQPGSASERLLSGSAAIAEACVERLRLLAAARKRLMARVEEIDEEMRRLNAVQRALGVPVEQALQAARREGVRTAPRRPFVYGTKRLLFERLREGPATAAELAQATGRSVHSAVHEGLKRGELVVVGGALGSHETPAVYALAPPPSDAIDLEVAT